MKEICTDLAKEYEELDTIVAALDESGWNVMTPAEGWTVKDRFDISPIMMKGPSWPSPSRRRLINIWLI